jgi:type I site-specific restriction endonuclease
MEHGLKIEGGETRRTILFAVNQKHAKFIGLLYERYPAMPSGFISMIQ